MGEEKSKSKSSRREEEDKEAKRRARSSRDGGSNAARSSSRRADEDREAKERARRSRGASSSVGASRSHSGSSEDADREAKRRARSGGSRSSSRPGVESVTSGGESRESRKARRDTTRESVRSSSKTESADKEAKRRARGSTGPAAAPGVIAEQSAAPAGQDDIPAALAIEAETIEDENDRQKEIDRQVQERMARYANQTYAPNRPPPAPDAAEDGDMNGQEEPKSSKWKCIVLVVLILVGGGVGAYMALKPKPEAAAIQAPAGPAPLETKAPTSPPTTPPTVAPVVPDTPVPTAEPLQFPPLDDSDCAAVKAGEKIAGQDDMESRRFEIAFDVGLSIAIPTESWKGELVDQMNENLIPLMVGCDDKSRRLREGGRQLLNARYLIGNMRIEARDASEEECAVPETGTGTCTRVKFFHEFFVKDSEASSIDLLLVFNSAIDDAGGLFKALDLTNPPFKDIVMKDIKNLEPTTAPSTSPSAEPTIVQSMVPSVVPSDTPSGLPTAGPTASPTQRPTVRTTPGPTTPPTQPPTLPPTPPPTNPPTNPPTPPPTQATPGPTPPPTPPPTPMPVVITPEPTPSPTVMPITPRPSPGIPYYCSTQTRNCGGGNLDEVYIEMTSQNVTVFVDYCRDTTDDPDIFAWGVNIRTTYSSDVMFVYAVYDPETDPSSVLVEYELSTCFGQPCMNNCFGIIDCEGVWGQYPVEGSQFSRFVTVPFDDVELNTQGTGFAYVFNDGNSQIVAPGFDAYYQLTAC